MPWQNTRLGAGEGERTAGLGERHGRIEEGSEARATKYQIAVLEKKSYIVNYINGKKAKGGGHIYKLRHIGSCGNLGHWAGPRWRGSVVLDVHGHLGCERDEREVERKRAYCEACKVVEGGRPRHNPAC